MLWKKTISSLLFVLLLSSPLFAADHKKFTPKNNSPAEIFGYLERAVQLIQQKKDKAYINSYDGYNIAHLNKNMVGKYFISVRDKMGNAFFAELQKAAMSKAGRGWVEFWWPKPGETKHSRKIGFVMSIPGERLWIGTGA